MKIFALFSTALIFTFPIDSKASSVALTAADSGRTITLRIGQELTLNLESNPSTGYRWFLANPETSILTAVGKPAFKQGRPMPGVGGVESWIFRATEGGNETLQFEYQRPWETNTPPVRKVLFHVKVRSAKE